MSTNKKFKHSSQNLPVSSSHADNTAGFAADYHGKNSSHILEIQNTMVSTILAFVNSQVESMKPSTQNINNRRSF